jgi:hypothetical protein
MVYSYYYYYFRKRALSERINSFRTSIIVNQLVDPRVCNIIPPDYTHDGGVIIIIFSIAMVVVFTRDCPSTP